jgi:hypothetical protein
MLGTCINLGAPRGSSVMNRRRLSNAHIYATVGAIYDVMTDLIAMVNKTVGYI